MYLNLKYNYSLKSSQEYYKEHFGKPSWNVHSFNAIKKDEKRKK